MFNATCRPKCEKYQGVLPSDQEVDLLAAMSFVVIGAFIADVALDWKINYDPYLEST